MKLNEYLELLRTTSVIGTRIIKVLDLTDHNNYTRYNVILIPQAIDADSGVAYTIISEDKEIQDRLVLWPSQFEMVSAWKLDNLVKAASILKSFPAEYFESEVSDNGKN